MNIDLTGYISKILLSTSYVNILYMLVSYIYISSMSLWALGRERDKERKCAQHSQHFIFSKKFSYNFR